MTTLAISSGRSRRRIGIIAVVASAKPGMASDGRSSGGSIAPGQTQLTRMSRPAALVSHHPVPVYLLLVDPAGAVEGVAAWVACIRPRALRWASGGGDTTLSLQ